MKPDYIQLVKKFLADRCPHQASCTGCQYRMSWGCAHPQHPMNQAVPAVVVKSEGAHA